MILSDSAEYESMSISDVTESKRIQEIVFCYRQAGHVGVGPAA